MERTLITVPKAIQMVALLGVQDLNLRTIEAAFASVNITVRGNEITLRGAHDDCSKLENLFNELMVVIRSGNVLNVDAVNRAIEMLDHKPVDHPAEVLSLNIVSNRGRTIRPKTANHRPPLPSTRCAPLGVGVATFCNRRFELFLSCDVD